MKLFYTLCIIVYMSFRSSCLSFKHESVFFSRVVWSAPATRSPGCGQLPGAIITEPCPRIARISSSYGRPGGGRRCWDRCIQRCDVRGSACLSPREICISRYIRTLNITYVYITRAQTLPALYLPHPLQVCAGATVNCCVCYM